MSKSATHQGLEVLAFLTIGLVFFGCGVATAASGPVSPGVTATVTATATERVTISVTPTREPSLPTTTTVTTQAEAARKRATTTTVAEDLIQPGSYCDPLAETTGRSKAGKSYVCALGTDDSRYRWRRL